MPERIQEVPLDISDITQDIQKQEEQIEEDAPTHTEAAAALAVEVSLPQNLLVPEKMRRSTLVNRIRKMTF